MICVRLIFSNRYCNHHNRSFNRSHSLWLPNTVWENVDQDTVHATSVAWTHRKQAKLELIVFEDYTTRSCRILIVNVIDDEYCPPRYNKVHVFIFIFIPVPQLLVNNYVVLVVRVMWWFWQEQLQYPFENVSLKTASKV